MYVSINGDTRGFDRSIDRTQRRVSGLGASFGDIFKGVTIGTLVSKGINMAISGLDAMRSAGMEFNKTMENNLVSFEVMLGGLREAETMLSNIKSFADVTPFGVEDLSSASKILLQYGVTAENIMPTIKMLGDVSAGNKEKFKSLALALGQVRAAGRLMGQEVLCRVALLTEMWVIIIG